MKIYVPLDNIFNKCYVIQSENVIRAYDTVPRLNSNYNYRDYYINSNYIYRDGQSNWSQYSTLPICLSNEVITNDFYYRNDFTNVLINVFIILILCVYLPYRIVIKSLLGGRLQ